MGMLIKGILAIFWLAAVPAFAGVPFLGKKQRGNIAETMLAGYLALFSLMEILTLPMTWLQMPLHVLTASYGAAAVVLAVWGIFCMKNKKALFGLHEKRIHWNFYFCLAVLLIVLQVIMCTVLAHADADDCFYVGAATTDVYTDTIFEVNPYTGREYVALPRRYVLSPFPVFLAVVSQLSGGLHPSIMAHVFFPLIFLPIAYMVQYCLAGKWFRNDKKAQGIYLFLAALLCSFSGYSVYNAGNFQMVRLWQGKALLAAAFLPLLFYLCISILLEKEPSHPWFLLILANISCCLLSSMGIILAPLMTGCFLAVCLLLTRKWKRVLLGLMCCLPSILLGILYISL
ncbi:MAG TPA: hypothetical protein IAA12_08835 [Candidatus Blautia intestinipullorum]|nr:hypothetical protein [Candidatus Blautia intestinipullorum]